MNLLSKAVAHVRSHPAFIMASEKIKQENNKKDEL